MPVFALFLATITRRRPCTEATTYIDSCFLFSVVLSGLLLDIVNNNATPYSRRISIYGQGPQSPYPRQNANLLNTPIYFVDLQEMQQKGYRKDQELFSSKSHKENHLPKASAKQLHALKFPLNFLPQKNSLDVTEKEHFTALLK